MKLDISLTAWTVMFIISIILFIGVIVLIIKRGYLRNKYYHEFHDDESIREDKTANSKNYVYFVAGESKKFIKKYVICKTLYDKYVICNFNKPYKDVIYYVFQYNSNKKVIAVIKMHETNTIESSKIIALKNKCAYVNIVVGKADGIELNSNVIKPLTVWKIRWFSILKSCALFLFFFIIRHILCLMIAGIYAKQYLNSAYSIIYIIFAFVYSFLSYLITQSCYRKKNIKAVTGGVADYEFL